MRNPKQSNSTSVNPPARSYAKRKFKPRSATARTARNNKLTMSKRSVEAYAACDIKLWRGAKFKEPLNFKVRQNLRILKFTVLKFRYVR